MLNLIFSNQIQTQWRISAKEKLFMVRASSDCIFFLLICTLILNIQLRLAHLDEAKVKWRKS